MIDIVRSDDAGQPLVWSMSEEEDDREGIIDAMAAWMIGLRGAQPVIALQRGGGVE